MHRIELGIPSEETNALEMKSLALVTIGLLLVSSKVSCESYSKSCFLNYMLKHDLLDKTYQGLNNGGNVDQTCELAVNETISKLRFSVNDVCVADFWRKKYVSETIIMQYLLPQFKGSQSEVQFDDRFTIFKNKALNISNIICNNKEVFRPDLGAMMRKGRAQKDSKSKELECLQKYITIRNKPLDEECSKIVSMIKDEFYKSTDSEMKRVFAPPNDNLVNLKCSEEKAKNTQLFEKIFFFVILATTKNMSDKQIDVLLRSAEGVITSSTRLIFECMH